MTKFWKSICHCLVIADVESRGWLWAQFHMSCDKKCTFTFAHNNHISAASTITIRIRFSGFQSINTAIWRHWTIPDARIWRSCGCSFVRPAYIVLNNIIKIRTFCQPPVECHRTVHCVAVQSQWRDSSSNRSGLTLNGHVVCAGNSFNQSAHNQNAFYWLLLSSCPFDACAPHRTAQFSLRNEIVIKDNISWNSNKSLQQTKKKHNSNRQWNSA